MADKATKALPWEAQPSIDVEGEKECRNVSSLQEFWKFWARFYTRRTTGCDRDHRSPDRVAAASFEQGPRAVQTHHVPGESAHAGPGDDPVRQRQPRSVAERKSADDGRSRL